MNPFTMLSGEVNGLEVLLRPVQFDSDDYDSEFRKPCGNYIRPTMAVTTCPKCCELIEHIIAASDDISGTIKIKCKKCTTTILKALGPPFPFIDPIAEKVLTGLDVNSTALNIFDVLSRRDDETTDEPKKQALKNVPFIKKKSGGLGGFMQARDQWKKWKNIVDSADKYLAARPNSDVFDAMGSMMDHVPPINITSNTNDAAV